ncbi:NADH dehydrogenase (ubiquinone) SGDH subunit [Xylocopa sonorina]|uniref:NADH dehydrogenase (ubiquinone) SGDH subunit n=1 Tax=Xylocopa sonorina TaxID=1818115 RepID=UPI00403AE58C
MAVLSRLLLATNCQKLSRTNGLLQKLLPKNNSYIFLTQNGSRRWMSEERTMHITATRWQWSQTKNWLHFYILLGVIPAVLVIVCSNLFIGDATLEAIPEGYEPKEWEYYKHPISRFLARYCLPDPKMEYEKYLAKVHKDYTRMQLTNLERNIRAQIGEHSDYKYFSFKRGAVKDIIELRKRIDEGDIAV